MPVMVEIALPPEETVDLKSEVVMAELDPAVAVAPALPVARAARAPPEVTPTAEQAETPYEETAA